MEKKIATIDAEQWLGDIESQEDIEALIGATVELGYGPDFLRVPTVTGVKEIDLGDWVIKSRSTGEITTMSDEEFQTAYESVG